MRLLEPYFGLCRRYAKRLGDRPADRVYQFLCSYYFYRLHRFRPNFTSPTTFTEAVWKKMLFNRDRQLRILADKFAFRSFVESRVGAGFLVPLIWHGRDPENIPFEGLPDSYVIKASHGSGFNHFVSPGKSSSPEKLKGIVRQWIARDYCLTNCVGSEWAYQGLEPTVLIEPFLSDGAGNPPPDFKFYCFGGRVEVLQIDFERVANHTRSLHDRNFRPLDVRFTYPAPSAEIEKPAQFAEMIELAEKLSAGLDMVRVDLYATGGRLLVGELTNYPGGGRMLIRPRSFDIQLATSALGAMERS